MTPGAGTFSPALPSASNEDGSDGRLKFKFKGTLSVCDSTGVTGAKLPITGGSIAFQSVLPEAERLRRPVVRCTRLQL